MSGVLLTSLLTILSTALGLLIVDLVVPGVDIANFPAALIAAVVIGFVNGFIKPVLSLLSLPITILTLGLFALVINGICFWFASILVPGFSVHGWLGILVGPIVLALASTFLNKYFAGKGIGTSLASPEEESVQ
jgi:putative membrane protein